MGLIMQIVPLAMLAAGEQEFVDYAAVAHKDDWLRHPVYGDPSFDAFERAPGNPILRGAPPLEWPVNGFLFEDPVSGHWFVYVGLYAAGYAMGEDKKMICTVYRSKDRGGSWEPLGPIFPDEPFCFTDLPSPVTYAPDVSVVYDGRKYHLVYDFATAASTWATAMEPSGAADNGIGYAWSGRPEGPFNRTPEPVYRTGAHPYYRGKYHRAYAQTLIRRANDWLVLAMMDSGPHFSWAMVGMTAERPEGPYSEPVFLRTVDDEYFHPPLLEFYPAFTYEGYVYAPATSVARNRNFQAVFRAKIEDVMKSEAWEPFQCGSVWHAADVPNEYYGIWGQTFSGFVDGDKILHAMFPSRNPEGMCTINLASRPWEQPYRPQGFTLSGHAGPSIGLLLKRYAAFELDTRFTLRGAMWIFWDNYAPLGPDCPAADATLHPASHGRHQYMKLTPEEWGVGRDDTPEGIHETGFPEFPYGKKPMNGTHSVRIRRGAEGNQEIFIDDTQVWSGPAEVWEGALGIQVGQNSHVTVDRFAVKGTAVPHRQAFLYTEGVLGAGAAHAQWKDVADDTFRFGMGAESAQPGARGKWNVEGHSLMLWAPRGPGYGIGEVLVDGARRTVVNFNSPTREMSQPLFASGPLEGSYHAISVRAKEGVIPLDCVEVVP